MAKKKEGRTKLKTKPKGFNLRCRSPFRAFFFALIVHNAILKVSTVCATWYETPSPCTAGTVACARPFACLLPLPLPVAVCALFMHAMLFESAAVIGERPMGLCTFNSLRHILLNFNGVIDLLCQTLFIAKWRQARPARSPARLTRLKPIKFKGCAI